MLGYEKVAQKPIEYWTPCQWHLRRAILRNMVKSSDEYQEIDEMLKERRPIWFDWRLKAHERRYTKNSYFQVNYGYGGKIAKPHQWGKCFNFDRPGTTMACEAYHKHIKRTLPRNSSMVELWKFLGEHDAIRKDADMLHQMDMPHLEGSHFQKEIRRTHKKQHEPLVSRLDNVQSIISNYALGGMYI